MLLNPDVFLEATTDLTPTQRIVLLTCLGSHDANYQIDFDKVRSILDMAHNTLSMHMKPLRDHQFITMDTGKSFISPSFRTQLNEARRESIYSSNRNIELNVNKSEGEFNIPKLSSINVNIPGDDVNIPESSASNSASIEVKDEQEEPTTQIELLKDIKVTLEELFNSFNSKYILEEPFNSFKEPLTTFNIFKTVGEPKDILKEPFGLQRQYITDFEVCQGHLTGTNESQDSSNDSNTRNNNQTVQTELNQEDTNSKNSTVFHHTENQFDNSKSQQVHLNPPLESTSTLFSNCTTNWIPRPYVPLEPIVWESITTTYNLNSITAPIDPPSGYAWSWLVDIYRWQTWTKEKFQSILEYGHQHWADRNRYYLSQCSTAELLNGTLPEEEYQDRFQEYETVEDGTELDNKEDFKQPLVIAISDKERYTGAGKELLADYTKYRDKGGKSPLRDYELFWLARDLPTDDDPLTKIINHSTIMQRRHYLREGK